MSANPPVSRTTGTRAVAQRVHLIESARLVDRRHQQDVRAGVDAVRERVVESDVYAAALGCSASTARKASSYRRLAAAEDDRLRAGAQEPRQDRRQQSGSPSGRRAATRRASSGVFALSFIFNSRSSARLLRALAGEFLALNSSRRCACRSPGSHSSASMPLRIPLSLNERLRRMPSSPAPRARRLDLARVVRRDGRHLVGEDDPALHRIDLPEMLDGVGRPVAAVQPGHAECRRRSRCPGS